nr:GNAT family N-acetyltransferase [Halorubellus sp. JP-L1]
MFPDVVRTDRLRLVRETDAYVDLAERYASLAADSVSDEEVEYAGVETFEHLGDAREYVERREDHWEERRGVVYGIRPRDGERGAGELAGEAELSMDWPQRAGHLSCSLRKPFWGRGYSGERAAALIALAFERFDLEVVRTCHAVGNENSRRAVETYVERFGGERTARTRNEGRLDGEPCDLVWYTIPRRGYADSGERPPVAFRDGGAGA